MPDSKVLIYLVRRDLRVSDNPILHALTTKKDHGYTHLFPLYVFNPNQLEVKGFIQDENTKNPYREARSQVGGFWRCGPHRAKFIAESVWDLKNGLEDVGSGLCFRVGHVSDVVEQMIKHMNKEKMKVGAVWMVGEEGVEENREESAVKDVCRSSDVDFKLWTDEKYLIDDRDLPLANIEELSDVFTTYRKTVEPIRDHPRPVLPSPIKGNLPPYPNNNTIASQQAPFTIPNSLEALCKSLLKPLAASLIKDEPAVPSGTPSAHPFQGGESYAQKRLSHLITSGSISTYQSTRNGLLGLDFSTKLSAYLSLGCITARQIHASLLSFEDGTNPIWQSVKGYGDGENEGTKSIRFELLWRDYMRLCTRKFGPKLFRLSGFKSEDEQKWSSPTKPREGQKPEEIKNMIERFLNGTTGMGLIDASLRELFHTGYTSNRARQNVASFLAKHLKIDWRIGAEWYESMLVDYDLSSNWGNWQYLAGVGNDPRGEARIFNPVKQAFDYDPKGDYVKAWVPELRELSEPSEIFQAWTIKDDRKVELGLNGLEWVENPLMRIDFQIGRRGRNLGRPRGGDRGGRGGGQDGQRPGNSERSNNRGGSRGGGYAGRGYGSSRGHIRGYGNYNRGRGDHHGGGRESRVGMVEREMRDFHEPTPLSYYTPSQYLVTHHY